MKTLFCVAVTELSDDPEPYNGGWTIHPELYHFEVEDDGSGEVEKVIYEKVQRKLLDKGYIPRDHSISVNKVSKIIKL